MAIALETTEMVTIMVSLDGGHGETSKRFWLDPYTAVFISKRVKLLMEATT